jgi:hypothetical protein
MFFVVLVVLFYARQAGTHMDPRSLRQVGDWHPVLLPPILYLNTAVLLLSSLSMERARLHIFREFDVLEEWLGLGLALDCSDSRAGAFVSWRTSAGMETINRAGIRVRSLGHAGKLFLLRHHRASRRALDHRRAGFALLPLRSHSSQTRGGPADRSRLSSMVLARDGLCLAGIVWGFGAGAIAVGSRRQIINGKVFSVL